MQWYGYVLISVGVVLLLIGILSYFAKKQEEKSQIHKNSNAQEKTTENVENKTTLAKAEEKIEDDKEEDIKPIKDAKKEEPKLEPAQTKQAEKVGESKAEKHDQKQTNKTKDSTNNQARYHVSLNNDKKSAHYKRWRVRKENSKKTIKFFDTQKEAIEYAEKLADAQNTSIIIHKVDGSIRKQDYS